MIFNNKYQLLKIYFLKNFISIGKKSKNTYRSYWHLLVQTVDSAVTVAEGGHAVEVCVTGVLASSGKQVVDPVVSVGASDSE